MIDGQHRLLREDRPLYTIREAAEILRVSERKVAYLLSSGRLRRVKIGVATMIRRDELEAVIDAASGGPPEPLRGRAKAKAKGRDV
jgi:excisionase family DNA binding protein